MRQFLVAALIGLIGLSCNEPTDDKIKSEADTKSIATSVGSLNFYKRLEGTIAGQPVVLHLQKQDNNYEGVYYYRNIGQWILLFMDSIAADSVFFSEYIPGDSWSEEDKPGAHWKCKIADGIIKGEWIGADQKTYQIALEEKYPKGSLLFALKRYEDSLIAFPGNSESPVARIDYLLPLTEDNSWLNDQVKAIVGLETGSDIQMGFREIAKKYFSDYKENLPETMDTTEPLHLYNYAQSIKIFVRYNSENVVVLESLFYDYSGGAHGNYGSNFFCYDIAREKQLELKDIITADSAMLQPIVEQHFRKQYHIKEASLSDVLFDEHLALNDNFYLTNKGIGFLYNPYEVASYAQGQINVFVPFMAVKQYLTPYIKERFNVH